MLLRLFFLLTTYLLVLPPPALSFQPSLVHRHHQLRTTTTAIHAAANEKVDSDEIAASAAAITNKKAKKFLQPLQHKKSLTEHDIFHSKVPIFQALSLMMSRPKLIKEMINTAIEMAHEQELQQEHRVAAAHAALEQMLKKESLLETFGEEIVHQDVETTDKTLEDYEKLHTLEDSQKHRELLFDSDLSHFMEDYVDDRLDEAHEKELLLQQEEEDAQRCLDELRQNEDELKETLQELLALEKVQEMEDQDVYHGIYEGMD